MGTPCPECNECDSQVVKKFYETKKDGRIKAIRRCLCCDHEWEVKIWVGDDGVTQ